MAITVQILNNILTCISLSDPSLTSSRLTGFWSPDMASKRIVRYINIDFLSGWFFTSVDGRGQSISIYSYPSFSLSCHALAVRCIYCTLALALHTLLCYFRSNLNSPDTLVPSMYCRNLLLGSLLCPSWYSGENYSGMGVIAPTSRIWHDSEIVVKSARSGRWIKVVNGEQRTS